MLRANGILRNLPWPAPFDRTWHRLRLGDARDLSWLDDASIHLVVTSPPYWTLKGYEPGLGQLGGIEDYEVFLSGTGQGLDRVCPYLYLAVGFVALLEMSAFLGKSMEGISLCPCMPTFKSVAAVWDSIA